MVQLVVGKLTKSIKELLSFYFTFSKDVKQFKPYVQIQLVQIMAFAL
jgi:hypothetical protein